MHKSDKLLAQIKQSQLIAILDPKSGEDCLTAYELFHPEGIVLEIALRSTPALEGIRTVLTKDPEALILAGTVMTVAQAEAAVAAGAAGIVSADYIPEVVTWCVRRNVMCVPGGLTDIGKQLAQKARDLDCADLEELRSRYPYQWIYKLFPAFAGLSGHMDLAQAWRGPYKDVNVIYTGGISIENLETAVGKDPHGIFCASALTKNLGDPEKTKSDIKLWKNIIKLKVSPEAETRKPAPTPRTGAKFITFGELMARLSPPPGIRLHQTHGFDLHFGGAEANVAVSLARLGLPVSFVSALPANAVGDNAIRALTALGVDISRVQRRGERLGLYYLEHGFGPRASQVLYDRANSSFSNLGPGDLDWEEILDKAVWFHWTGITPALGEGVGALLRQGLEKAREKDITVSVDLNFRRRLWTEAKAQEVMTALMPLVDICIGNEEDPMRIFGIAAPGSSVEQGRLNRAGYQTLTRELWERFGFKKVAITLRQSISASENIWSACLYNGKDFFHSREYDIRIIDRVGTGDAFAAGLICGLHMGKAEKDALEFAVAAACLKHSIYGDFNLVSRDEVERLAAGEKSGRIQR